MAISTITRTSWTDDDGTGTTGTIINNSQLQAIYAAIDQLFSGSGSYTTLSVGGKFRVEGAGLELKGAASPGVSAATEGKIYFDSTLKRFRVSQDAGAFTALGNLELLRALSGTSTAAGATNVDTVAISGLTANDRLLVLAVLQSNTQLTAPVDLFSSTDSLIMARLTKALNVAADDINSVHATLSQAQSAATTVVGEVEGNNTGSTAGVLGGTNLANAIFQSMTTAWTGSWTLALRHGGVTAGGTFRWSWIVLKVIGS